MAKVRNWTPDRLPSLAGKRYLITGGNSGIGLEAAKILAAAGADIVIACRNPDKAEEASSEIAASGAGARSHDVAHEFRFHRRVRGEIFANLTHAFLDPTVDASHLQSAASRLSVDFSRR